MDDVYLFLWILSVAPIALLALGYFAYVLREKSRNERKVQKPAVPAPREAQEVYEDPPTVWAAPSKDGMVVTEVAHETHKKTLTPMA